MLLVGVPLPYFHLREGQCAARLASVADVYSAYLKRQNTMNAKRVVSTVLLALLLWGCKTPNQPALGEPLADLTPDQKAQFLAGKKAFQRAFEPKDGLGPLFNANSCGECHEDPVLGGSGDEVEVHATRFGAPNACDPLFHEGGPVIQQDATPLLRALGIEKEQIPPSATAQARRSSPPLFGFGLVDGIPESTILSHEDPHDANGDGIFGRANRTIDGRVGRFGRKAAVANLLEFNAGGVSPRNGNNDAAVALGGNNQRQAGAA